MGALVGKSAIVTGAGQGVGQGIARALAHEGAAVAVLGRSLDKLELTCEQLRQLGGDAVPVRCDVTDTDAVPDVVSEAVEALGGLDVLVNNAYNGSFGPLLTMSDEKFQRGFRSGPFASFAFMKACHPYLKAGGGGNIINLVTSAMVRWDLTNYAAYASAKTALRTLTRAAATEWGPDGIRVNAIAPHARSPSYSGWEKANPEQAAQFTATIPLGYVGDCEQDIGRAVVMLLGQDARYLTGATIPLDGGQANFD